MKYIIAFILGTAFPILLYWASGGNFERNIWLGLIVFFAPLSGLFLFSALAMICEDVDSTP